MHYTQPSVKIMPRVLNYLFQSSFKTIRSQIISFKEFNSTLRILRVYMIYQCDNETHTICTTLKVNYMDQTIWNFCQFPNVQTSES